jgi:hypothetical protein
MSIQKTNNSLLDKTIPLPRREDLSVAITLVNISLFSAQFVLDPRKAILVLMAEHKEKISNMVWQKGLLGTIYIFDKCRIILGVINDRCLDLSSTNIKEDSSDDESKTPIKKLPLEVLAHIFNFLNVEEQRNLPLVCKDWKKLCESHYHLDKKSKWRSHRIALHLLKDIPDFGTRQNSIVRNLKIINITRAANVWRLANYVANVTAKWATNYSNSLNQAFDQLPDASVMKLLENYNKSPVIYFEYNATPHVRIRLPSEMLTLESFIELTKSENNSLKNFCCYVVVPIVAVTSTYWVVSKINGIWKSKDIDTNKQANMENLKHTLAYSLALSSNGKSIPESN